MTDDAQPAGGTGDGQGGEGGDAGGLYAEHLSAVPQEHRDLVEGVLKGFADKTVSPKFQEHAEYRKQWEPFQELGVHELDPQGLGQLLEFAQSTLADPEALNEWVLDYARENGLVEDDSEDSDGEEDPYASKIQELEAQLAQFTEKDQQREQAQREQQINSHIDGEYERLKSELGDLPDQDWEEFMWARAHALADESEPDKVGEAIEAAYKQTLNLIAQTEKGLLKRKGDQPAAPEQGGRPGTGAEPVTDFKQARAMAAERLRQG